MRRTRRRRRATGSAESAANELAAALVKGDPSGLDRLVRDTEDARQRLLSIEPPVACAAHHRETRETLDDALGMLRALQSAARSSEPGPALAEVAVKAGALQERAEALRREEAGLRTRFVLPAATPPGD